MFLERTLALTKDGIYKGLRSYIIQEAHEGIKQKLPFYNELGKTGNSKRGLDTRETVHNEMYREANAELYSLPANHPDRGFLPQQLKVRLDFLHWAYTFRLNFESRQVEITEN